MLTSHSPIQKTDLSQCGECRNWLKSSAVASILLRLSLSGLCVFWWNLCFISKKWGPTCRWCSSPSTTNTSFGEQRPWEERMVWFCTTARTGNWVHTSSWQSMRQLWSVFVDFLFENQASCSLKVKSVIFSVISKANEEQAMVVVLRDMTWTFALLTIEVTSKGSVKPSGQIMSMPLVDPNVTQWYALRTTLDPIMNESNKQAPSGVECAPVGDWSSITEAGLWT